MPRDWLPFEPQDFGYLLQNKRTCFSYIFLQQAVFDNDNSFDQSATIFKNI